MQIHLVLCLRQLKITTCHVLNCLRLNFYSSVICFGFKQLYRRYFDGAPDHMA